MKTPVYLSLLFCLLYISSCSNKEEDKKTFFDPSSTKVKTATYGGSGLTFTYAYTTGGQVEAIQVSDGSKTTFTYDSAAVTETRYNIAGNITSINYILLNDSGLAANATLTDAGGTILSRQVCTFDERKQKTSEINYSPNNDVTGKIEWAWYGGDNLLNYSIFDSTGTNTIYSFFQTYFDDPTSVGNVFMGQSFHGKGTKSLVRKSIRYSYLYGDYVQSFEYVPDGLQRISQVKTYDHNGTLKTTDSYTYY